MAKLNLTLPYGEIAVTGKQVTFVSPCNSEGLTHILIDGSEFELVDSNGNTLVGGAFTEGAMVSVILNVESSRAYVQNADVNHSLRNALNSKAVVSTILVDDDTDCIKVVPDNVSSYAEVTRVGGITNKCNNLIPFPYGLSGKADIGFSTTSKGTTIEVLPDRGLLFSGTPTGWVGLTLTNMVIPFKGKMTFSVSGDFTNFSATVFLFAEDNKTQIGRFDVYEGESKQTITFDIGDYTDACYLQVDIGKVTTNKEVSGTMYVMLNAGDTALPYEPYFDDSGFPANYATSIESVGANLLPFPYRNPSASNNGCTFTSRPDGGIALSGFPTGAAVYSIYKDAIPKQDFTVSLQGDFSNVTLQLTFYKTSVSGEEVSLGYIDYKTTISVTVSDYPTASKMSIVLKRHKSTEEISGICYPMLNYGLTALPYTPYFKHTIPIPELTTRIVDDYGEGINDTYCNYIEWHKSGKKLYNRMVSYVMLDKNSSDIIWDELSEGCYAISLEDAGINIKEDYPVLCNLKGVSEVTVEFTTLGDRFVIKFYTVFKTRDEWLDYLSNTEEDFYLIYALPTTEVIDVSDYIPDIVIPVETGGTVKIVNEMDCDLPNTVVYYGDSNEVLGAKTFVGSLKGKATTSETSNKAECDSNGRKIVDTYALAPIISSTDIVAGETRLETGQSYHVYK